MDQPPVQQREKQPSVALLEQLVEAQKKTAKDIRAIRSSVGLIALLVFLWSLPLIFVLLLYGGMVLTLLGGN